MNFALENNFFYAKERKYKANGYAFIKKNYRVSI